MQGSALGLQHKIAHRPAIKNWTYSASIALTQIRVPSCLLACSLAGYTSNNG
jgi:hypothetical protein